MHSDIHKAIRKGHFEKTDGGELYLPRQKVFVGGYFIHEVRRGGEIIGAPEVSRNLIPNEGLDYILSILLNDVTPSSSWYIGLYDVSAAPAAGWTADTLAADTGGLSLDYDEATLQEYVDAAVSSQSVTNSANKATFTINATTTIHGAFMIDVSTKAADYTTAETLLAASQFSPGRDLVDNDELLITYTIGAASA